MTRIETYKAELEKYAQLNDWSLEKQIEILLEIMDEYPVKLDPFYNALTARSSVLDV